MKNILTNKVSMQIDYNKIYTHFKVVKKELNKQDYIKRALSIRKFKQVVPSVAYSVYNNQLIYLVGQGDEIIDSNSKKMPIVEFKRLPKYLVVNMLFKLLAREEVFFEIDSSFNNVFYIVKDKKNLIETIEIYIDKNDLFNINAVAFKKLTSFPTKKILLTYSKKGKILVPDEMDNKNKYSKTLYVKGNYKNKKIHVEYFSKERNKYQYTKSYFAGLLLENIDKYLYSYVKLEFLEIPMKMNISYNYNHVIKKDAELMSIVGRRIRKLNVINTTSADTEKMVSTINDLFINIQVNVKDKPRVGEFNMIFTYEKEYYILKNETDPYENFKKVDPYSQCYEMEEKGVVNVHKIKSSMKELVIKDDLKNNEVSLAQNSGIKNIYYVENKKEYKVVHQLAFDKQKIDYNILRSVDLSRLLSEVGVFENYGTCEVVVEDYHGNISAIVDTKLYAVIDYRGLYKYYKENDSSGIWNPLRKRDNVNRNQTSKYHLVHSLFGVKTFKIDGLEGYIPGRYENSKLYSKNFPARILFPLKGKGIDMDIILNSLEYYFVKSKDITVMPYQLKYLREMSKINLELQK